MRVWPIVILCALAAGCKTEAPAPKAMVEPQAPTARIVPSAIEGTWVGDRGTTLIFMPNNAVTYKPATSEFSMQGEYSLRGYALDVSVGYGPQTLGNIAMSTPQKFRLFMSKSDYEEFHKSSGNSGAR